MNTPNENSLSQRAKATTETVHQGINRAAEVLHGTTDNAAASAVKLAESADRGVDRLREKQEQARIKTLSYTRQHPLRALAISVGVGFLFAKILGRR